MTTADHMQGKSVNRAIKEHESLCAQRKWVIIKVKCSTLKLMSKNLSVKGRAVEKTKRERVIATSRGVDAEYWAKIQDEREIQQRELGGILNEAIEDWLIKYGFVLESERVYRGLK